MPQHSKWWPKEPRKRTVDKLHKEMEYFRECMEMGRPNNKGKREVVVFKKELAIGRWYSRKNLNEAIHYMKNQQLKKWFSDMLRQIEDEIELRLFRWWLSKKYDTGIVRMYMWPHSDIGNVNIIVKDERVIQPEQAKRIARLMIERADKQVESTKDQEDTDGIDTIEWDEFVENSDVPDL